jgi:hypothetical protein
MFKTGSSFDSPAQKLETSRLVSSGAAYQNTDKKDANAAYDYLKCGPEKRGIHVALADPANYQELDGNNQYGKSCRRAEIWNEVRKRVTDAAGSCHQTADDTAQQRFAAPGQAPVIGESFREAHRNPGAEARR